ncbi:permease-like cell division protein FtsX [Fervidibacillus halotolerans]|uniref:Cell division protein FtsX n=1 Tax=Fervidibacillus halotolerans TaxID=2980027 RepID=A0A9E8LYZ6_9BACI|nr:permease-like cell division protein FtsX [Fervidibacillus halotolerans]WAA12007.1 permease-like cell division protein FtsX [Fervidibacillus halotolerans]
MKIRTLGRHIKESGKSIARNGWMTFASISAVTVTLLLVGVFYVILMNLNEVATSIEKDVSIKVLVDTTAGETEREDLLNKLKKMDKIESIIFSSKEQELDELITSFGDEGDLFKELYEERNPLNDAFIIKTKDPIDTMEVAKQIETFDYVYKVNYGKGEVEKLFNVIDASRNVGLALIIGLLFTAIFLISNTIKITINSRRKEIEIMRLVGATNGFIRWPFFLEGLWLGILGSIIPITLIAFLYKEVYSYIQPKLEGHFIRLLEFTPFIYEVSGLILGLGCLIGTLGSLLSVRKFLKV